jgi:hypothetical protein
VIVIPVGLDLSCRIETEHENHQDEDDWCHAHEFFESSRKHRRGEQAEQNTEQRT